MTNITIVFTDDTVEQFLDVFSYDFEYGYFWVKTQDNREYYYNKDAIVAISKIKVEAKGEE